LKRDMDYIHELLLKIEAGKRVFETLSSEDAAILRASPQEPMSQEEADKLGAHLDLMQKAGLIEIESSSLGRAIVVRGLTGKGHDLLDSRRVELITVQSIIPVGDSMTRRNQRSRPQVALRALGTAWR
jgi:hypothetical protein